MTAKTSASVRNCGTRASDMSLAPPCPTRHNYNVRSERQLGEAAYLRVVTQLRDSRPEGACL